MVLIAFNAYCGPKILVRLLFSALYYIKLVSFWQSLNEEHIPF